MSVKAFYHYGQGANKCTFRQYDYGPEKNMRVYNSLTPPDYSFKNIKAKTYAFYGDFDNVFPPQVILNIYMDSAFTSCANEKKLN